MAENASVRIIALQSAVKTMTVPTTTSVGDAIKQAKLKVPKGARVQMNKKEVGLNTTVIPNAEICIIPRGENGNN